PDGKILASYSRDRTLKLWNLQTLTPIWTIKLEGNNIHTIAFSPNGKILASAGRTSFENKSYHTIKIWNVATGEEVVTLITHKNNITSLNFSTDGKFLVSGSEDNFIKVWQVSP
ncbi:MAG: WD40 repeat domain-containing protein, partial [Dolichospermum sp.]